MSYFYSEIVDIYMSKKWNKSHKMKYMVLVCLETPYHHQRPHALAGGLKSRSFLACNLCNHGALKKWVHVISTDFALLCRVLDDNSQLTLWPQDRLYKSSLFCTSSSIKGLNFNESLEAGFRYNLELEGWDTVALHQKMCVAVVSDIGDSLPIFWAGLHSCKKLFGS